MREGITIIDLQAAVREFGSLGGWHNKFAVTLKLKRFQTYDNGFTIHIDEYEAQKTLGIFLNRLNTAIYKSAFRRNPKTKRVTVFSVLEGDSNIDFHYHIMVDCPRDELVEDFANIVNMAWKGLDWARGKAHVTPCDDGWKWYSTKLRTKQDYGLSIDYMNTFRYEP